MRRKKSEQDVREIKELEPEKIKDE